MRIFLIIFFVLFISSSTICFANESYVLPYPSSMPGSLLYKPKLFLEYISRYWYFGNFGQFKYYLKESDKYLVEAKTLFEYGQYLHASSMSLKYSNEYFKMTLQFLEQAAKEGKDISGNRRLLKEAARKHIEVLNKLSNDLPDKFEWRPERDNPTTIYIRKDLEKAISIRSKYL